MKPLAPWIVTILIFSLSPLDGYARTIRPAGGTGDARTAPRNPVTNSRVNTPAQRPAQRPAQGANQRPAQRPAERPAQRPADRPAQRPAERPAQRPADRPAQRPAERPAQRPSERPAQRPADRPTQRPNQGNNQRPNQGTNQRPVQRPVERPGNRPAPRPETPPQNRPATRPENRPTTRPENRPTTRPENRPTTRPENRPTTRPENRPTTRPENRPNVRPENRPNRPNTRPGDVTFPRPGERPGGITRPGGTDRPGINRPGGIDRPSVNRPGGTDRPSINRPGGIDRPSSNPPGAANRPGGINRPGATNRPDLGNRPNLNNNNAPNVNRPNRPGWGNEWGNWGNWNSPKNRPINRPNNRPNFNNNNINVNINNNVRNSQNWSHRPSYWGSRPWWHSRRHSWHHGSWNCGWSSWHRRNNGIAWGIAAWSLGNLAFNSGYQTFVNPFPAPPIVNSGGTTIINYSAPITVVAGTLPPGDPAMEKAADQKSDDAMEAALTAFQKGDFAAALTSVDLALTIAPGDPALHEFRALVFFALGRFNDSAGVLNAVLASGPGWDWTTMSSLFDSQETYIGLLRKLEDHTDDNPDSAAAHFVLGYHYFVLGHLEYAVGLFDRVIVLEPRDTVSVQLRNLIKDSMTSDDEENAEDQPVAVPVNPDKLIGTWVSKRDDGGSVTLVLKEDGNFTWTFDKGDKAGDLAGSFDLTEENLLVLASEDSQLVGEVTFPEDSKLSFTLAGGPRGDPGLNFNRVP